MHIYYWVAIAVVVLNIIFSLSLIFIERKDPTTTWAWLLILLVLPGVGFVLYLMFGQNLSRQKIFKDKIISDEKREWQAIKMKSYFLNIAVVISLVIFRE